MPWKSWHGIMATVRVVCARWAWPVVTGIDALMKSVGEEPVLQVPKRSGQRLR